MKTHSWILYMRYFSGPNLPAGIHRESGRVVFIREIISGQISPIEYLTHIYTRFDK